MQMLNHILKSYRETQVLTASKKLFHVDHSPDMIDHLQE